MFVGSLSADAAATCPVVDDLLGLDPLLFAPNVMDLADLGRACVVPADGCGGRDDAAAGGGGLGAVRGGLRTVSRRFHRTRGSVRLRRGRRTSISRRRQAGFGRLLLLLCGLGR